MSSEDDEDKVNHPKHYNSHPNKIECIDVIEHMPFCVGSAVKYLWRAGLKEGAPTMEDVCKARWYVDREVKRLEKMSAPVVPEAVDERLKFAHAEIERMRALLKDQSVAYEPVADPPRVMTNLPPQWGCINEHVHLLKPPHRECMVTGWHVVRDDSGAVGDQFPMICHCDCPDCKRRWFKDGRPILRDRKIVREAGAKDPDLQRLLERP